MGCWQKCELLLTSRFESHLNWRRQHSSFAGTRPTQRTVGHSASRWGRLCSSCLPGILTLNTLSTSQKHFAWDRSSSRPRSRPQPAPTEHEIEAGSLLFAPVGLAIAISSSFSHSACCFWSTMPHHCRCCCCPALPSPLFRCPALPGLPSCQRTRAWRRVQNFVAAARISALRLRPVSTADLSDGCSDSSFSNHSQASSPGTLSSPHSPNLLARSSDTSQVGLSSGNTQRAQSTSGSGAAIIGSSPRFTTLGASASAAASSFPQPHISLNSNDVLDTESSRRQAAFYNVSLARSPGARATTASIAPPNFTGESSPGISSVARSLRGAQGRRGRTASFALPPRARSILRASSRSPDLRLHGQSDLHSHLAGASTTGGRKQYRGPRLSGGFEAQANLGSNSINDGHGTMAHEPGTRGARSKTPQPVLLRHQPPLHSSHQLSSQHKQSGSKHRSIRRSASREVRECRACAPSLLRCLRPLVMAESLA